MDKTKLKPCPFCGGEPKSCVRVNSYGTYDGNLLTLSAYIECTNCGISKRVKFDAHGKDFQTYTRAFENAISNWNDRYEE